MSKKALMAFTNAITTAGQIASKDTSIGKTFRGYTELAKHKVYVSKSELEHELADLIYRSLGYDSSGGTYNYNLGVATDASIEQFKFDNADLKKLTNLVYNNLKKAFLDIKATFTNSEIQVNDAGNQFTVDIATEKNNYDIIGKAFSKAWSGKGQYGGLKEFIVSTLTPESAMVSAIQNVEEKVKTGLDRGHGESTSNDISNIENFINVIGINSIRDAYTNVDLDNMSQKELGIIEDDLKKTFHNGIAINEVYNILYRNKILYNTATKSSMSRDSFMDLMQTYVETTVTLLRKIENNKIHLQLNTEKKIKNLPMLQKLAQDIVVAIRPQSSLANQTFGGMFQRQMGKLFEKQNVDLFTYINKWLSGGASGLGKGQQFPELPLELKGSKSLIDMTNDSIYEGLVTGKITNKKSLTKDIKNASPMAIKVGKIYKVTQGGPFVKKQALNVKTIAAKRKAQPNLINIVNMINMKLAETIRENMGSPRLNYRTGRFAKSAVVLPASREVGGLLRLPYTYMKYPYQTFEVGYARGSLARDPRKVISESIKELATRLVLTKMRVIRV
jgi:hypothetical protein